MNRPVVIIPSRNPENLRRCLAALQRNEPGIRIIVVDDTRMPADRINAAQLAESAGAFVIFADRETGMPLLWRGSAQSGKVEWLNGGSTVGATFQNALWKWRPPDGDLGPLFCYSVAVNEGIRAAWREWGPVDVVLLNDDAELETWMGFTRAQQLNKGGGGIIGACSDAVGNVAQIQSEDGDSITLQQEPRMVCFLAVLITAECLMKIGLLDERYIYYGMDDDDYCMRAREVGQFILIARGVFVRHTRGESSYRGATGAGGDFTANLKRFIRKWGVDNHGASRERSQFAALFPQEGENAKG